MEIILSMGHTKNTLERSRYSIHIERVYRLLRLVRDYNFSNSTLPSTSEPDWTLQSNNQNHDYCNDLKNQRLGQAYRWISFRSPYCCKLYHTVYSSFLKFLSWIKNPFRQRIGFTNSANYEMALGKNTVLKRKKEKKKEKKEEKKKKRKKEKKTQ